MEEKRFEKTSSAEVNINAKGQPSYSVKIYFDVEEKSPEEVADTVKDIMAHLKEKF